MEEWRPVKNWETFYEVSNYGRVRSITKMRPNTQHAWDNGAFENSKLYKHNRV